MKSLLLASFAIWLITNPATAQVVGETRFSCNSVFSADLIMEDLSLLFGEQNLTDGEIEVGEGVKLRGALLFEGVAKREVKILWKERGGRVKLWQVRISGESSRWVTESGITLGTSLTDIENINRFPFRLVGFGWDFGGTILSWGRGELADLISPCRLIVRLAPSMVQVKTSAELQIAYNQVIGDREYSSGHPAMQTLNPKVYELILTFGL